MLPGFKENWGDLATGQQAGLGGRKLLIAALPWKEWVWLRCDVKLLAGRASKCWKSCLLSLNELLCFMESLEPHGLSSPGTGLWIWAVWLGSTGAGLKKRSCQLLVSLREWWVYLLFLSKFTSSLMLKFPPARVSSLFLKQFNLRTEK